MAQHSLQAQDGYLRIDNRLSGPLSLDQQAQVQVMESAGLYVAVAPAGGVLEAATITCAHCHTTFLKNPQRTRARGYCQKCDAYVCDGCTTDCVPMAQVLDTLQETLYQRGR